MDALHRENARQVRRILIGAATAALRSFDVLRFVWMHPGNRGKRLRAIGRLLIWQAWERVVGTPWTIDIGGLRMRCYPHSTGATGVLYCGLPEWSDMRFVLDFLNKGDVFIDVGANVGVYSLLGASTDGTDVIAFEPGSRAYDRLNENVQLNGLGSRVRTYQLAVGASEGMVSMTTGLDTVNRVVSDGNRLPCQEVSLVSLDHAIPREYAERVALIKVDVEGYEVAVLRGATSILRSVSPALIIEGNDPLAIAAMIEPLGYRPFIYDPDARLLSTAGWVTPERANILALKDTSLRSRGVSISSERSAASRVANRAH